MPSYKNYRNQYKKNSITGEDQFAMPQHMTTSKEIDEKRRERMIDWVTYFRRNPHRFVEEYFQIKLHFYQRIWIYLMGVKDSVVCIAARASAKSWTLAVLCCARAVLYPGSHIVIVASTKGQAGLIVEDKIKGLVENSPNLAREVRNITTNMNKWSCEFHSGSVISIVASRDSSRGKRATFICYEEFRLLDREIVDAVIRPFAYIRQVPYLKNPLYSEYVEEPKEVFISSAYFKSSSFWWWNEVKKTINGLMNGENVAFLAADVRLAIHHKIKTVRQIKNEMNKMDSLAAEMEYLNIPVGESNMSYFKLNQFIRARKVDRAFYPQKIDTYSSKKNPYEIPKVDGEIRILACDIAMRKGKANDLSINLCLRLIPTSKGYNRQICYMESFSGVNSITQALRIKQVYTDFEADYIVLDVQNAGAPVYDLLGQVTVDSERDTSYPAMTIFNHDSIDEATYTELRQRTLGIEPLEVVYCFSATSKLNSIIAVELKDKLQKKMVEFLIDEAKMETYLIKKFPKEYMGLDDDISSRAFFSNPYVQTSLLINEAISLEAEYSGEIVKLVPPSGGRKDRVSALLMGNYFAGFLDAKLLRYSDGVSDSQAILDLTMVY